MNAKEFGKNIGDITPPILILDQFHTQRNEAGKKEVFCYRPTCEGCRYDTVCRREESSLEIGEGLNIRRAFMARPGWKIVCIDYKQIEIRVAAVMSREPFWVDAFEAGRDLHEEMARVAYKIPEGTPVPKHLRDAAKQCNFAAIYLCKPFTLSNKSDLTVDEARDLLEIWKKTVNRYMEWTRQTHCEMSEMWQRENTAYVTTFFGRRRYFDSLIERANSVKNNEKQFRSQMDHIFSASVNSRIQGTAADLMKLGMVELVDWITTERVEDRIRPLLTVHDEMVLEVNLQNGAESFEHLCKTAADRLSLVGTGLLDSWAPVKVETDIEIGDNWAKATTSLNKFLSEQCTKTISIPSPPTPLVVEVEADLLDPIKEQEYFQRQVDTENVILLELNDRYTRMSVDPDNDPLNERISVISSMLWKAAFPLRRRFVDPAKPYLASQGRKLYYLFIAGHRNGVWTPYKVQHLGTFSIEEITDYHAHNADLKRLCKPPALINRDDLKVFDQPKPKRFLRKPCGN